MNILKSIVKFDLKKGIIGTTFAAVVMAVFGIWFSPVLGAALATLFLLSGFVKLELKSNCAIQIINIIWSLAVVAIMCMVAEMMVGGFNFLSLGIYKVLLNFLCIFVVIGIVFAITADWKLSVTLPTALLLVLVTVNGFVFHFRGSELNIWDFASVNIAVNIMNQYKFNPDMMMVSGWTLWAAVVFAQFAFPKIKVASKIKTRIISFITTIIAIFILYAGTYGIEFEGWANCGTQENGYYLNFLIGIKNSVIKQPKNYSAEKIEKIAQEYSGKNDEEIKKKPNIIVIMNESYSDFGILGEIKTNQPVTPFVDSMAEDTIRGHALTSVFGGKTANAEFEFLTGHSLGFLPKGVIPYQLYVKDEKYSLAWQMKAMGYETVATHPYYSEGWARTKVYPLFGFDRMEFKEDYPAKDMIRGFISDREMYEHIMNTLGDKNRIKPLFLFGITMQNHGGYEVENYESKIKLEGFDREYPEAEQYLSLINESDKAIEKLLSELKDYPQDTIVLFFGDHLPKVEEEFYEELSGKTVDTNEGQMLRHTVPFFIWANYDIPEENIELTSLNYLSRYLIEAAGLKLPPYHRFLKNVEEEIPAMNALGYWSGKKNAFVEYDLADGAEKDMLTQYEMVQYNNLFGKETRNKTFFNQYIGNKK